MTAENRRANIADERARASSALAASRHLFDGGFVLEAVSRLSYALLYQVRGLLLTKGLEPKSHEAALRLLSLHFVKPGAVETSLAHLYARMMKFREEADYNTAYAFTRDEYVQLRGEVEAAAATIDRLIRESGVQS